MVPFLRWMTSIRKTSAAGVGCGKVPFHAYEGARRDLRLGFGDSLFQHSATDQSQHSTPNFAP
jgi:hypothetical protein